MAAKKIIKGRDLMLFGGNDHHSYAYATNHTFTMTAETTDISSKDHGIWGAVEIGRYNWEITSENLYTVEDYDEMFDMMITGEPILVAFGLKQEEADPTLTPADGNTALPNWWASNSYYEGKVLITSLVANANNGENATYSITLSGVGSIKKVANTSDDTPTPAPIEDNSGNGE